MKIEMFRIEMCLSSFEKAYPKNPTEGVSQCAQYIHLKQNSNGKSLDNNFLKIFFKPGRVKSIRPVFYKNAVILLQKVCHV